MALSSLCRSLAAALVFAPQDPAGDPSPVQRSSFLGCTLPVVEPAGTWINAEFEFRLEQLRGRAAFVLFDPDVRHVFRCRLTISATLKQ